MSFDIEGYADAHDVDLLKADGFDDCCIGVVTRFGQPDILCYSESKVMEKLMQDMPYFEAMEHFEFNIKGAWVGDLTPCFLVDDND